MYLAIPGAVGHFYHLQMALTDANHASRATDYLYKNFHMGVQFWKYPCVDMSSRPTFFAEIVQLLATEVGHTNAWGIECGGVWIYPKQGYRPLSLTYTLDRGHHDVPCQYRQYPWSYDQFGS